MPKLAACLAIILFLSAQARAGVFSSPTFNFIMCGLFAGAGYYAQSASNEYSKQKKDKLTLADTEILNSQLDALLSGSYLEDYLNTGKVTYYTSAMSYALASDNHAATAASYRNEALSKAESAGAMSGYSNISYGLALAFLINATVQTNNRSVAVSYHPRTNTIVLSKKF